MEQEVDHVTAERRARQKAWAEAQKAKEAEVRRRHVESAHAEHIRMLRLKMMEEDEKSCPSEYMLAMCQLKHVEMTGVLFELANLEWRKTTTGLLAIAKAKV